MAYCVKCGARVDESVRYCSQCGAEIPVTGTGGQREQGQHAVERMNAYSQEQEGYFDRTEVSLNRVMAVLSYFGFLVLVPLFAGNRRSEYLKLHLNQGILLLIGYVLANLLRGEWVFGMFSFFYHGWWMTDILGGILQVALVVMVIVGIIHACTGVRKELPFIGKIQIIK